MTYVLIGILLALTLVGTISYFIEYRKQKPYKENPLLDRRSLKGVPKEEYLDFSSNVIDMRGKDTWN